MPKPRVNLTRFHGVLFAPNSRYRAQGTPAKRGRGGRRSSTGDPEELTPAERRISMTWAQRLKRVFGIDIKICRACSGAVKVIACIENPAIIKKILTHLEQNAPSASAMQLPRGRAPPGAGWFN